MSDAIIKHLQITLDDRVPPKFRRPWPSVTPKFAWEHFAIWLLTEECASPSGQRVAQLYQRVITKDNPTKKEWAAAGAEAGREKRPHAAGAAGRSGRASALRGRSAALGARPPPRSSYRRPDPH